MCNVLQFQTEADMLPALLMTSLALLVRWGVSLWPQRGQHRPLIFRNQEAQRHCQEITVNLTLVTRLAYHGLIIEHDQFQYNNISLGLALMAGA